MCLTSRIIIPAKGVDKSQDFSKKNRHHISHINSLHINHIVQEADGLYTGVHDHYNAQLINQLNCLYIQEFQGCWAL